MYTVVVESPAKAKTINKYLGNDYTVIASFGHVRDLPSKDGSVEPDNDFHMHYQVDDDAKRHITAIAGAVKKSDILYLATDPDREGEAISWHIVEALIEKKALPKNIEVKRIVFHEITKKAITEAIEHPRDVDMDLVNAQQARRALDYLVGFNLSPVLWRKLPGAKSAGRVQSVALRLICERDEEIEKFIAQEYWDISTALRTEKNESFSARLTHWEGAKLEKFSIVNETEAKKISALLENKKVTVATVKPKQMRRNPYPPFMTSTLQMDASRKLGFSAKKTMQLAQKLYEGIDIGGETTGLITYMRTDGVTMATEAIMAVREYISKNHGANYLPSSPRMYQSKAKNAQEAHEAIRPTNVSRSPDSLANYLEKDMLRLYDLIWKRTVACQMEPAVYDQVVAEISVPEHRATLRANGSVLKFDGFLALYREGLDDDQQDEEENRRLPMLAPQQKLDVTEVSPEQHFTEPLPRFTEASLVKKLEELGIGRPSTYASIISVLQERGYVKLEKKRFIAEMRGRLVNAFLVTFFQRYVEYDFTANLEAQLDEISDGKMDWKQVLRDFWQPFIGKIDESKTLTQKGIIEELDHLLAPIIFGKQDVTPEDRKCPTCGVGELHLRTGKFGAFLGCSNYPDCNYTRQIDVEANSESGGDNTPQEFPKLLGTDPKTGLDITMKKGPYGVYVELAETPKPKRASLPKGVSPADMTLERALSLLALPREVGIHPESQKKITAGLGRFGPYILHDAQYISLKGDDDVLTIGMNRAVDLIAENKDKKKASAPVRVVGQHEDGKDIGIYEGKYGAYVKHGKINATLPKGTSIEELTLEQALELLVAKGGKKGGKKKAAAKKPAAEKTEKKPAAKKPAAKKAPAKKKKAAE